MNLSIIDIGSLSIKQYVFSVEGSDYKQIYYKRYSDADLGKNLSVDGRISDIHLKQNLELLRKCLEINKEHGVEKCKLIGTAVFRKAINASEVIKSIKDEIGLDLEVLDQEKEAYYLYRGFTDLVDGDFAAINIGGGSIELVIGNKRGLRQVINLGFGVNYLRENFIEGKNDWAGLIDYLKKNELPVLNNPVYFITGILACVREVSPKVGYNFPKIDLARHEFKISVEEYSRFVQTLRDTPLETLRSFYPEDPTYLDNVAIGQTVYLEIGKLLGAKELIPSQNDLTDGLVLEMVNFK